MLERTRGPVGRHSLGASIHYDVTGKVIVTESKQRQVVGTRYIAGTTRYVWVVDRRNVGGDECCGAMPRGQEGLLAAR